jgi:predicted DNA-binding transcriptional regulator AlpA
MVKAEGMKPVRFCDEDSPEKTSCHEVLTSGNVAYQCLSGADRATSQAHSICFPGVAMAAADTAIPEYLRYRDLVARGIVNNRMTLWRWQRDHGFPEPVPLGPNTRAWIRSEVDDWLAQRAAARDKAA